MTECLLNIEGLHAGYDGVAVVRDLTMHVNAGEVVALLGPNGAGKTTTLMTISGMGEVISGSVEVLGNPVPSSVKPIESLAGGSATCPRIAASFSNSP